jgi:hypothetical protein
MFSDPNSADLSSAHRAEIREVSLIFSMPLKILIIKPRDRNRYLFSPQSRLGVQPPLLEYRMGVDHRPKINREQINVREMASVNGPDKAKKSPPKPSTVSEAQPSTPVDGTQH